MITCVVYRSMTFISSHICPKPIYWEMTWHVLVWKSMIQLLLYGAAQAWQFEVVLGYKAETKIGLFLHWGWVSFAPFTLLMCLKLKWTLEFPFIIESHGMGSFMSNIVFLTPCEWAMTWTMNLLGIAILTLMLLHY